MKIDILDDSPDFGYFFLLSRLPTACGIFFAHLKNKRLSYLWLILCLLISFFIITLIGLFVFSTPSVHYIACFPFLAFLAYLICTLPSEKILKEDELESPWGGVIYGSLFLLIAINGCFVMQDQSKIRKEEFWFSLIVCFLIAIYGIFIIHRSLKIGKQFYIKQKIEHQQILNGTLKKTHSIKKIEPSDLQNCSFIATRTKQNFIKKNYFIWVQFFILFVVAHNILKIFYPPVVAYIIPPAFIIIFLAFYLISIKNNFLAIEKDYLIVKQNFSLKKIYKSDIKEIRKTDFGIILFSGNDRLIFKMEDVLKHGLKKCNVIEDIYDKKFDVIFQNLEKWHTNS